jgi:hypothetical protein
MPNTAKGINKEREFNDYEPIWTIPIHAYFVIYLKRLKTTSQKKCKPCHHGQVHNI